MTLNPGGRSGRPGGYFRPIFGILYSYYSPALSHNSLSKNELDTSLDAGSGVWLRCRLFRAIPIPFMAAGATVEEELWFLNSVARRCPPYWRAFRG